MAESSSIPASFAFPRTPPAAPGRVPGGLVAATVRGDGAPLADRCTLSATASRTGGSLSPFRSPADRMEAATGVALGRIVDRLA